MTSDPPDSPDAIDSLFQTAPGEFVRARNALVKSLKAGGQRQAADRAAQLSRPSASVWASNQVARRSPELVARLAAATVGLQRGVARDGYAAAINEHRELLGSLRAAVEKTLAGGGLRVAPPAIAAAVQNFRAGLADEATRPALLAGRLEQDVGLQSGDGLFGMAAPPGERPAAPAAAPHPGAAAKGHAATETETETEAETKEQQRTRHERERELARARAEAERRIQALRKAAGVAAAQREKQERAVAAARRELEAAEQTLAAAREAEQEAGAALDAAASDLEKLPR
jgi:hypothetical protein